MLKQLFKKIVGVRSRVKRGANYNKINLAKKVAERSPLVKSVLSRTSRTVNGLVTNDYLEDVGYSPIKEVSRVNILPKNGDIQIATGDSFKVEVSVLGQGIYELEIDHSLESILPEFSVYASESDPYGGDKDEFDAAGVQVKYSDGKWEIDFGEVVTETFSEEDEVRLYFAVRDESGNYLWGSMSPTTEENTRIYSINLEE